MLNRPNTAQRDIKMDGVAGLEPAMTGSKPVALPLGYTPIT